ncbi:uncharacterized protein [Diabrotica undecimpunctata]|uniref:uncharacterized protein n=1 Tax=Diabrotica undecimpunctata TaxID=50387 RepID=UPI003B634756
MRPILSSINAPNINVAQFLTDILSQAYNYKNEFNIVDSFQFSEFINNYQLPREYVLVSFDVVSLFSNLPLSSVVTSLRNHWNEIQPHSPVSWEIFSELLKLTFDTNYLIFNDKYYRQIFGTPMGSSISPILVNFVLDDLINESISKLDFQVPFVKRYVDDLILATPPDKILSTLSVFNSVDPHLQFTCELEVDNSIPFLDMRIIRTHKIFGEHQDDPYQDSGSEYVPSKLSLPISTELLNIVGLENISPNTNLQNNTKILKT